MRVLVCGGRDYTDRDHFYEVMNEVNVNKDITEIIHGGALGADDLANWFARDYDIPRKVFYAEWNVYGKSAGPIRNREMLLAGNPDLVVAFPGGKGTAHMIKIAKEANIPVKEII